MSALQHFSEIDGERMRELIAQANSAVDLFAALRRIADLPDGLSPYFYQSVARRAIARAEGK